MSEDFPEAVLFLYSGHMDEEKARDAVAYQRRMEQYMSRDWSTATDGDLTAYHEADDQKWPLQRKTKNPDRRP